MSWENRCPAAVRIGGALAGRNLRGGDAPTLCTRKDLASGLGRLYRTTDIDPADTPVRRARGAGRGARHLFQHLFQAADLEIARGQAPDHHHTQIQVVSGPSVVRKPRSFHEFEELRSEAQPSESAARCQPRPKRVRWNLILVLYLSPGERASFLGSLTSAETAEGASGYKVKVSYRPTDAAGGKAKRRAVGG